MVAGGLGEWLGSKEVKISLICEIMTELSFIELYLAYLSEFARISKKSINLLIMTSDDNHEKTTKLID